MKWKYIKKPLLYFFLIVIGVAVLLFLVILLATNGKPAFLN